MKILISTTILGLICLSASCNSKESPLQEGYVVSGMIWENPVVKTSDNSGSPIKEASKIEIYNEFVVIYLDDNIKRVVPWGFITELKIK